MPISKDKELEIINFYKNKLTYKQIAEKFGISKSSVRNVLARNNIPRQTEKYKHKKDIYLSYEINIIEDYNNGLGCDKLAKKYNLSQSTIFSILKNNNIEIKSTEERIAFSSKFQRNEKFNIEFFKNNSNELAYIMGFILADGHFTFSKAGYSGRISINIHKNDIHILHKFCDLTGLDYNSIKIYRGKYSRVSVRHPEFCDLIQKWGIVPRKTYEPIKFDLPTEYIKPYIVGFMDGDGFVSAGDSSSGGYYFNFTANKITTENIINFLSQIGFDGKKFVKEKGSDIWNIFNISNKKDFFTIIRLLEPWKYSNFDRKWKSATNKIKEIDNEQNL